MPNSARKLVTGSTMRLTTTVATALVSILLMPFVVHRLGDRMYGIWTLVATFVGYYGILDLGLSSAITRYLARAAGAADTATANQLFNTALRIFSGLALLVVLVSGIIAALSGRLTRNPEDAALLFRIVLVLGVSVAISFPLRVFTGVLESHLRFDLTASFDLLSLILRSGLTVVVLLAGYSVVGLAWVTFLSGLPAVALYVYFTHREMPFLRFQWGQWNRTTARSLFSYSVYSLVAQLADLLRFRLDAVVVAAYLGFSAVTHYRIGSTLLQYFMLLMSSLMGVFPSVFSRQEGASDFEGLKKTFYFATKVSTGVACFVGFGLIAWGKAFIGRWMGPQYLDAYPVLVVLVSGMTVSLIQGPSISLLYGTSRHKFVALFNSIEGIANLVLSLIFVRYFGMLGVALGTMVPMLISKVVVQPIYVCRVAQIEYWDYMRRMGSTLLVALGGLVIPFLVTQRFSQPDYRVLCAIGTLSLVSYGLIFWKFGLSSSEAQTLGGAIWPRLLAKKETVSG